MTYTGSRMTLLLVALGASPVWAQEPPPLETDRPDQTESSGTVPRGTFQLEVGAAYADVRSGSESVDSADWLSTLGRWGLTDAFELRFVWAGWTFEQREDPGASAREDGGGDFGIGFKWKLREERGAAPRTSLLVDSTLPAGSRDFTSDRPDPALRLSMSHTISPRIGLGYNAGMVWSSAEDAAGERDTTSRWLYTLASSFALTDTVGVFTELFGSFAGSSSDRGPEHYLDGGVTWRLRPNLQLDASGGFSLIDGTDDWFAGLGVSARFPR